MTVDGFDANHEFLDPILGIEEAREYLRGGTPMARVYLEHPHMMDEETATLVLSERQLEAFIGKCQEVLEKMKRSNA